jgi:hypothetical protein
MAVTAQAVLVVLQGVVLYSALLYKLWQLSKDPHDRLLQIVTACLTCGAVAYPLGALASNVAFKQQLVVAVLPVWGQEVFLLLTIYLLMLFFIFAAHNAQRARTIAWLHAARLAVALLVLTAAAIWLSFSEMPAGHSHPAVSMFYGVADFYTCYALLIAARAVQRYRRSALPRLARGLQITQIGLLLMATADGLFVTAITTYALSHRTSELAAEAASIVLPTGVVAFLVGVSYPGAAMRAASARIWLQQRSMYRAMEPLWTLLADTFPENTLNRANLHSTWDRFRTRGIRRLFYRRAIEIRDGLLRLSPHIAHARTTSPTTLSNAEAVQEALRTYRDRVAVPERVEPIAAPRDGGLFSDVHELVVLASALRSKTSP